MKKILVVEDDNFYRKIYKKKFEVGGYEVETAENGIEGIEKMKGFKPDLVFMDLMMPKMDGFEMMKKVMEDDEIRHIPVIALTNLSTADDAKEVVKRGARSVIVKSDSDPEEVLAEAKKMLG